eukprot:6467479-Amphidinium_carterae.2
MDCIETREAYPLWYHAAFIGEFCDPFVQVLDLRLDPEVCLSLTAHSSCRIQISSRSNVDPNNPHQKSWPVLLRVSLAQPRSEPPKRPCFSLIRRRCCAGCGWLTHGDVECLQLGYPGCDGHNTWSY